MRLVRSVIHRSCIQRLRRSAILAAAVGALLGGSVCVADPTLDQLLQESRVLGFSSGRLLQYLIQNENAATEVYDQFVQELLANRSVDPQLVQALKPVLHHFPRLLLRVITDCQRIRPSNPDFSVYISMLAQSSRVSPEVRSILISHARGTARLLARVSIEGLGYAAPSNTPVRELLESMAIDSSLPQAYRNAAVTALGGAALEGHESTQRLFIRLLEGSDAQVASLAKAGLESAIPRSAVLRGRLRDWFVAGGRASGDESLIPLLDVVGGATTTRATPIDHQLRGALQQLMNDSSASYPRRIAAVRALLRFDNVDPNLRRFVDWVLLNHHPTSQTRELLIDICNLGPLNL